MANAGNKSGTWTGTEAGAVTTEQIRVTAIIYYVAVADDVVVIKDGSNANEIMTLSNHTATSNVVVSFGGRGKIFPDGLYISSITAGSKIYIIPADSII